MIGVGAGFGVKVYGVPPGVRVPSSPRQNVTIQNIQIENFRNGIVNHRAPDLTVTGSTMVVCVVIGIQTGLNDRLTFLDNNISTRLDALLISGGSGHVWDNNIFESTGWYNHVYSITGSTITNNLFGATPAALAYGLYTIGSGNTFAGNTFTGYYIALWLDSARNNTLSFNTFRDAGRRWGAIYLTGGASNNTFYSNNFKNNRINILDTSKGPNIFNLPAPVGGNWFHFYDTPAEGCRDTNVDGFCDRALDRYNSRVRLRGATDFPL